MSNIIGVRPNCAGNYISNLHNLRAIEPPIYLCILANYYKFDKIIDAEADNLTLEQTVKQIIEANPRRIVILSTGTHPSAYIQQKDIMTDIKNALKYTNIKVTCLERLPFDIILQGSPNWSLIDWSKYRAHNWHGWSNNNERVPYGALYTSLSCPFRCDFCAVKPFYNTPFKLRSLKEVFTDIDYLGQNKIKNVKIMDELFIFDIERTFKICDYIIEKQYDFNIWAYARIDIVTPSLLFYMKKAGVNWLAYGIESGNETIRKYALKGAFTNDKIREVIKMTKDNKINVLGNYMFGFWMDNEFTMQETLDFAQELNCEYSNFYCVVKYPGSTLCKKNKKSNKHPSGVYAQLSSHFKPLNTLYLKGDQVLKFRDKAFMEYFTYHKYLEMMFNTFGREVVDDIKKMTDIQIERNGNVK